MKRKNVLMGHFHYSIFQSLATFSYFTQCAFHSLYYAFYFHCWIINFWLVLLKYFFYLLIDVFIVYISFFFFFPIQLFFLTNTLNSLSGNLFISVSLIFRDFLLLSIESHSSAFSFCFTFSAFMNLGETLTSCDLKRVILCGSVLI